MPVSGSGDSLLPKSAKAQTLELQEGKAYQAFLVADKFF
jgi:hypothetical protein